MSNNVFELVETLRGAINQLNQIMMGDETASVTVGGVTKPSISKALADAFDAIQAAMQGRQAYATKAAMDADLAHAANTLAEVWNDPVTANNGLYGKVGASGSGSWSKSPYDWKTDLLNVIRSVSAVNMWRDPFFRYAYRKAPGGTSFSEGGRSYFSGGAGLLQTSASSPLPFPVLRGTDVAGQIDRAMYFDEGSSVKVGDQVTVSVGVVGNGGPLDVSFFVREAGLSGTVTYSSAVTRVTTNGYTIVSNTFARPASGSGIMVRVQTAAGYTGDFFVVGHGCFRGGEARPLTECPVSQYDLDVLTASITASITASVQSQQSQNLWVDSFMRRLYSKFGGSVTIAEGSRQYTQPAGAGVVFDAANASNPLGTPCVKLTPADSYFDRAIYFDEVPGLKVGDWATARVAVVATGSVSVGCFTRDGLAGGPYVNLTQQKTCAGYTEFEISFQRTSQGSSVVLRVSRVAGNTADILVLAHALFLGQAARPIAEAPISAKYLEDKAGTAAAGMLTSESTVNLCPDTFIRRTFARLGSAALASEGSRSYWSGAAGALRSADANSPYPYPVVAVSGSSSQIDRNLYLDEMGVKAGDVVTLTAYYWAPAGKTLSLSFFCRTGVGGTALASSANINVTPNGFGAQSYTFTVPVGTGVFMIRHAHSAGTDEHLIIAHSAFKGAVVKPLVEDAPSKADVLALSSAQSADDVLLPRKFKVLVGGTGATVEQANIYWLHAVQGYFGDKVVDITANYGRQLNECWRIEAGNSAVSHYNISSGSFTLSLTVRDYKQVALKSGSTTVELISKATSTPVRLLGIGDSITRGGAYLKHLADKLPNVTLQGLRHYDSEAANLYREGRGGWSLASYFTYFARNDFESPFMFPDGISGANYRGNVGFWKNIMNDVSGYDYAGFQRIARGWADPGAPFVYNQSTGYPLNPVTGWVVFDGAKPEGEKFQEWTGSAWVTRGVQPSTWSFDFAKYLERYAVIFGAGLPTHISIMLGANDFGSLVPDSTNLATYTSRLDTLISQAQAAIPGVKIIVVVPVMGGDQNGIAANYGNTQNEWGFRRNLQMLARHLLTTYDTTTKEATGIHVAPVNLVVDPVYGFNSSTENVNRYSTAQTTRTSDGAHPSETVGHPQMGDCLGAVVQGTR